MRTQEIEAVTSWQRLPRRSRRLSARWVFLAIALLSIVLLAVLPPVIGVNRYQRRISTSIGASLGRPVHFDRVTLNLLPLPGFTISNFVVEEDPPFGREPILRANTVLATLRISSLWRRRVEFSSISFAEPSINLVHSRSGRWNIEGLLVQAAHIETAPTGQPSAGPTPRFPYIEATGARLNLKQDAEKTPFSLTETDLALWQPDPGQWKMRLEGRPARTDTGVSDTGTLQVEATLGRTGALTSGPLDLSASWRGTPLGEASRLVFARDLGLRGELTWTGSLHGSLEANTFTSRLVLTGLRRSDFVPEQALSVDMECSGSTARLFHALPGVRCSWPVPDGDGALLALAGSVPDLLRPTTGDLELGVSRLPASVLLGWLRVASARVPPTLAAAGLVSGSVAHDGAGGAAWSGQASLPELRLSGARFGTTPLIVQNLFLRTADAAGGAHTLRASRTAPQPGVVLSPVQVALGGRDAALLEAFADRNGYTLRLSGMAVLSRLTALGSALPQLGDGLAAVLPTNRGAGPVRIDLTAYRPWGADQVWTDTLAHAPGPPPRAPRSRTRRLR